MAGDYWDYDGTVLAAWWPEESKVRLAANHGPMTSLGLLPLQIPTTQVKKIMYSSNWDYSLVDLFYLC